MHSGRDLFVHSSVGWWFFGCSFCFFVVGPFYFLRGNLALLVETIESGRETDTWLAIVWLLGICSMYCKMDLKYKRVVLSSYCRSSSCL